MTRTLVFLFGPSARFLSLISMLLSGTFPFSNPRQHWGTFAGIFIFQLLRFHTCNSSAVWYSYNTELVYLLAWTNKIENRWIVLTSLKFALVYIYIFFAMREVANGCCLVRSPVRSLLPFGFSCFFLPILSRSAFFFWFSFVFSISICFLLFWWPRARRGQRSKIIMWSFVPFFCSHYP